MTMTMTLTDQEYLKAAWEKLSDQDRAEMYVIAGKHREDLTKLLSEMAFALRRLAVERGTDADRACELVTRRGFRYALITACVSMETQHVCESYCARMCSCMSHDEDDFTIRAVIDTMHRCLLINDTEHDGLRACVANGAQD